MTAGSKLHGSAADPSFNNDPAAVTELPLVAGLFWRVACARDIIRGIDSDGTGSGSGNGLIDEKTDSGGYSLSMIHCARVPFSHLLH
jgi:hypothetical protein